MVFFEKSPVYWFDFFYNYLTFCSFLLILMLRVKNIYDNYNNQ